MEEKTNKATPTRRFKNLKKKTVELTIKVKLKE